jgi:hypothetical protein
MIAAQKLRADFNGLFGDLLCLSHSDVATDENGHDIELSEGMSVIAFDDDLDDHGNNDNLIAHGIVVRSPDWLQCRGSRWSLQIDSNGVRHESDLGVA